MSDPSVEFEARMYVYDLMNCAREFGFNADENWEVSIVTDSEKAAIEKKYFPTLSAKALPEMLAQLLASVKAKLARQLAGAEKVLDVATIRQQHFQYLVAFSPNRLRR